VFGRTGLFPRSLGWFAGLARKVKLGTRSWAATPQDDLGDFRLIGPTIYETVKWDDKLCTRGFPSSLWSFRGGRQAVAAGKAWRPWKCCRHLIVRLMVYLLRGPRFSFLGSG
jgi:hypothetical protein